MNFKKKLLLICFALITFSALKAQKVGLVLSGGGAPGIAHIGIIKALEENNIPIDYVTGTSIGAMLGGMYAMGMTPDEMIKVLKSEDFKHWLNGEVEPENMYFYRSASPNAGVINLRIQISKQKAINLKTKILPTNIVPPGQMNYAFIPLCAKVNAASGSNFDKLFVPFRCVASDVHKKKSVVFRQADLGDAIRASLTYPFMFKPIIVDSELLFDGGIYNNFPVDVMKADFKPDFILGSVVAYNPPKPDDDDIVTQLQNMIMNPTDYSVPSSDGLVLKFDLGKINLFDFSKVDELVKLGYDSTMKHMDEIKARVNRRISTEEVAQRRMDFQRRLPILKFQDVDVEGVDSLQREYVNRIFHHDDEEFDLKEFKQSYFKLISDEAISEVIPHAVFDSVTGLFDLHLKVKTEDQLKLTIGGNISSSTSNQAFMGLTYQNLNNYAQTAYINAQFGKMYNGLGLGTRLEMPSNNNWYLKLAFVLHKFDYFDSNNLFYQNNRNSNLNQNEFYSKFSVGFPVATKSRLELGIGYGALTDNYNQNNTSLSPTAGNDKSSFSLGSAFARIESYALNDLMYPTKGFSYSASFQFFDGTQKFESVNNPVSNLTDKADSWFQFRGRSEYYFPLANYLTVGMSADLCYSSRKMLQNYTSTVIQAPAFQPTPYSRTIFNPKFSANQFLAMGIKPIINFTDQLHLRTEFYCFLPYKTINADSENLAYYSKPFSSAKFMIESTLVYNFKLASAGIFANYNNANWNFGLNIGILLFNPKFTE